MPESTLKLYWAAKLAVPNFYTPLKIKKKSILINVKYKKY